MAFICRIMEEKDIPEILNLENKKLNESGLSEIERSMHSWNARWRSEFLEHYSKTGWSFVCVDEETNQLQGYFLGQALLFLDGQMQTLWIEHMHYNSIMIRDELSEVAYKLSREKHFQRVIFPNVQGISNALAAFKSENWNPNAFIIKTTK